MQKDFWLKGGQLEALPSVKPHRLLSHQQHWFALDWTNTRHRSWRATKIWEHFSLAAAHNSPTSNIQQQQQQQLTCTLQTSN